MIVLATAMRRHDEVRGSLAARLAREGTTARARGIDTDIAHDDTIIVRRGQVGLEPTRKLHNDRHSIETRIRSDDRRRVDSAIDRFVTAQDALLRRERAIADRDDQDVIPAWSVLAHPLLRAVLLQIDPRLAVGVAIARTGKDGSTGGWPTAGDHGMTIASATRLSRTIGARRHGMRIKELGLSGGMLRGEVAFWVDDAEAGAGDGPFGRIESSAARTTLTIGRTSLPLALLAGARGRPLDDVVRHPLFTGTGAVVTTARANAGDLIIGLKAALTPMAAPPDGVDATWIADLGGRPA